MSTFINTVLETRNLSMHFGGVRAVDNVNFSLNERELRCLIGPNGAGKSTFFKCLTGQLKPTHGDVIIRDINTTHEETSHIASLGIGIKTQIPNLFNSLNTEDHLWLAARRHHDENQTVKRVKQIIDRLGLGSIRFHKVGNLAHGQRQMVELGMVISSDPWLVLLDEPAAGMTEDETYKTAQLIKEINETCSIIVVEHDMNFIREISKKVTVFHQGAILMEDTMENISANPKAREVYLGHKT